MEPFGWLLINGVWIGWRVELVKPRVECDALCCDFFELLVDVTGGDIGATLCSGLELPFDSSPGNEEGGVGGKPKSKEKVKGQ